MSPAPDPQARLLDEAAQRFEFGAWELELQSRRFVATAAVRRMLRAPGDEEPVTLDTLREALLEPGRTAFDLALERACARGTTWDFGARLRHGDGAERYVQLRGSAITRDGRCTHLRGAVHVLPAAAGSVEARDTERAQRDLLQRLELAVAAAGVGFYEVSGRHNTWSPRMREIYGVGPDDPVPDRELWRQRFLYADDVAEQLRRVDAAERTGSYEHEHRIRRADGALRWVYSHAMLDTSSEDRRWLGITIDITARKLAELNLHDALDRLALASAGSGVGVWERSLDRDTARWSDELFRLYGLPVRAAAPHWKEFNQIVHPDDRAAFEAQWQAWVHSTEFTDSEFRVCRADGSTRWILARGRLEPASGGRSARVVGIAVDITARKHAEQRAQDASRWLEVASQAMRLGLWRRDLVTNELHWNDELRRMFGLAQDEPTPSADTVLDYVVPEDRPKVLESRDWSRAGREIVEVEYRIRRTDGAIRTLLSRGAVELDANGAPRVAYSAIIDVTEQRRTARALDEAQQRLRLAAEAGRFASWERNLETGEGRWDPILFDFYGLPRGEVVPSLDTIATRIHPQDRARFAQAWTRVRDVPGVTEWEARLLRDDGRIVHLVSRAYAERRADGTPLHIVGASFDVTESRNAALALEQSLQRLQVATETGGVGVWERDLATDAAYWDPVMYSLYGLAPRAAGPTRAEAEAFVHPDDRAAVDAAWRRLLAVDHAVEFEFRVPRPDGSIAYLNSRGRCIRDATGRPLRMVGATIDVTATRAAEQERERLAQRIEVAASELQLGLWEWDPVEETSIWNDQMYALFGRTRASFSGLTWLDAVHAEDRAQARAELDEVVRAGRSFDIEFRVVWPDGQVRWIAARGRAQRGARGQTARVFGVNWDVTERRRADLDREALAQRMQIAADAAHIGLWERDLDGGPGNWNAANFALWGLPRGARPPGLAAMIERVHVDDRAVFEAQFRAAAAGGEPDDIEYRVQHGDGSRVVLRSRVRRVTGLQRHDRVVGVNIDVTQQRLAEQALVAKETAERANEAKTEFLSRMSHELRTPLNAILGFAQLLELNPAEPLTTQQRGNVEHIQKAGWHLVSLIDEVLDLARIESGRIALAIERVPLQGVIEESLALIHAEAAAHGLHVDQHTLPDAPTHVAADRVRLKQVLANLLSNAVKYNRDNGVVAIEVAAAEDGRARITVRDTGRGMNAAQLARVFEPFNRLGLENSGIAGTGIGLSITRRLVLQMKGTIEVASQEGVGTRFVVTLPAAPAAESAGRIEVTAGTRRRDDVAGTVLYVEDNESNIKLVEQLLNLRPRVELLVARDGTSARVLAAVTQPDLVLIDMRLPDASGVDVLQALRAQPHTAGLACIAVSANALPEDIAAARAAGFDDYLTKPLGAEHFLTCIDAVLARSARTPAHN